MTTDDLSVDTKKIIAGKVRDFIKHAKKLGCTQTALAALIGVKDTDLSFIKKDVMLSSVSKQAWPIFLMISNTQIEIRGNHLKVPGEDGKNFWYNLGAFKEEKDPELRKEQEDAGRVPPEDSPADPPPTPEQKSFIEKGTELVNDGNALKEYTPMEVQDLVCKAVENATGPVLARIDKLEQILRNMKLISTRTNEYKFDLDE